MIEPVRVAALSMHTSPLLQPGVGDSGGMNVYVRELSSAVAQTGVDVTVYTRRWRDGLPDAVHVEPGLTVVHVAAGRPDLPKEALPDAVDEFTRAVLGHLDRNGGTDLLHANYWLSGVAGHKIKHELDRPLVTTFHTLARVKAEGGDPEPLRRERAEAEIIGCTDTICVSCTEEESQFRRLYGDPPGHIEIVAPGVEHAFFGPGDKGGARRAIGLGDHPVLLFVGRIQPLKGLDVAVRALAALSQRDAILVAVGGASGSDGDIEVARIHALVDELGVRDRVRFVPPQPHHLLATYYRAADLVLVPSRSESFGLVALEAAACGTPVVAAAVGGLITLVEHGDTGFLVPTRDPREYAAYADRLLADGHLAGEMAMNAHAKAQDYTWANAARHLVRQYRSLTERELVACG